MSLNPLNWLRKGTNEQDTNDQDASLKTSCEVEDTTEKPVVSSSPVVAVEAPLASSIASNEALQKALIVAPAEPVPPEVPLSEVQPPAAPSSKYSSSKESSKPITTPPPLVPRTLPELNAGELNVGDSNLHVAVEAPGAADVKNGSPANLAEPRGLAAPIGFHFNAAKIEGKGEDADPVIAWQDQRSVLAVFDGMGGAGSTSYQHRGEQRTGAYIAARLAANEVQRMFAPVFPFPRLPLSPHELKGRFYQALQNEAAFLESASEPSRLKSKLIRRLPTTAAVACLEVQDGALLCQTLWAGDSRCYALSSGEGLCQLTKDDLKDDGDALANLKGDSPISNCLSADGDFEIRSQSWKITLPIVMLAATDGCFGFLFSPTHFEYLLLDTLLQSKSAMQWRDRIVERLRGIAGDDCSMALLALGWPSFEALQTDFRARHQQLGTNFIEPLDRMTEEITRDSGLLQQIEERKSAAEKQRELLRQDLWLRYKETHDKVLASESSVAAEAARRGQEKAERKSSESKNTAES